MQEMYKLEGTVLTVVLPQDVDHPVTDLVRRETDHIINQNYIRKIVFDFTLYGIYGQFRGGTSDGAIPCNGNAQREHTGSGCKPPHRPAFASVGSASLYRNSESRGGRSMKENTNEMILVFDSIPVNEGLARVTAASFCTQLNPTLEEVSDVKTAVSEAVTNAIIHGYENEVHNIRIHCKTEGQTLYVEISDQGKGIEDVKQAMEPLFTTRPELGSVGNGIFLYGSIYGSFGSGVGSRERNDGKDGKNYW